MKRQLQILWFDICYFFTDSIIDTLMEHPILTVALASVLGSLLTTIVLKDMIVQMWLSTIKSVIEETAG